MFQVVKFSSFLQIVTIVVTRTKGPGATPGLESRRQLNRFNVLKGVLR